MAERALTIVEPTPDVNWQIPQDFQGIIAYNPRHDIQDYLNLKSLNGRINLTQYTEMQLQTNNRTRRQLEKAIGERFGVEKSTWEYFIEDGVLKSPDYKEPVLERYKKGQMFLSENGSVETEREAAEVRGITKVQSKLAAQELKNGQKLVIISPRGPKGTLYEENYFDIYEESETGSIEVTRYHSTHSYEGFLQAAKALDSTFKDPEDDSLNAAHFLDKPLVTSVPITEILDTLALDTQTQPQKESQEIIDTCTPIIKSYINTLSQNPRAIDQIKKTINTIFNVADRKKQQQDEAKKPGVQQRSGPSLRTGLCQADPKLRPALDPSPAAIMQAVEYYGNQPVRTSTRGCPGGQRGFTVNQPVHLVQQARLIGAASVVDFTRSAQSFEDTSDFPCGGTKKDGTSCTYIVRYGSGIRKCPECGREAVCV